MSASFCEKRPPGDQPSSDKALIAARNGAAVFAAATGSVGLRFLLHRLLGRSQDVRLFGPVAFAAFLGLLWFAIAFAALLRGRGLDSGSVLDGEDNGPTGNRSIWRTITAAAVAACILAISAWTGLYLNDEILESRSLPWIAPLITVQVYGFEKASRLYPCQTEVSDKECESYKWIPIFLAANSLAYFPFVLVVLLSLRHRAVTERTLSAIARRFSRWCLAIASAGLVTLQIMHGLNLATYDSLYPHPGMGHWHFGVWEQVNDITGTLFVLAGLLFPFYFYRAFRKARNFAEARSRLAELTSLAAVMVVALLGNPG